MDTSQLGRRERTKGERRQRIIAVARQMFREHGFERATTAEIAKKAGVGPGTVFRHVRDKDELLLLIIQDDLERATTVGIAGLKRPGSLVNRLLRLYRPRFEYWASDPELTKTAAGPVLGGTAGAGRLEFARMSRRQGQVLSAIAEVLTKLAKEQNTPLRGDPLAIARAIHYLYIGELRSWKNDPTSTLKSAMRNLEQHFDLLIRGIFRD